jgi:hypothetical protein
VIFKEALGVALNACNRTECAFVILAQRSLCLMSLYGKSLVGKNDATNQSHLYRLLAAGVLFPFSHGARYSLIRSARARGGPAPGKSQGNDADAAAGGAEAGGYLGLFFSQKAHAW